MPQTFQLLSPETGTEYTIYIAAPDPARDPGPWPLMLFLDGDNQFSPALEEYRALRRRRQIQPLLLVGAGYGAGYGSTQNRRGRDYTPTEHGDMPGSGGAEPFLKFLERALVPELHRRYPINGYSGIGGHSLGSLFVLFALFRSRRLFTHYLASAPSIWWDNRAVLLQAQQFRQRHPRLPARLFLGVGMKDSLSMTGDLTLLENALAERPFAGLKIFSERFPKLNHHTALPAGFRAGLSALWSGSADIHATNPSGPGPTQAT